MLVVIKHSVEIKKLFISLMLVKKKKKGINYSIQSRWSGQFRSY